MSASIGHIKHYFHFNYIQTRLCWFHFFVIHCLVLCVIWSYLGALRVVVHVVSLWGRYGWAGTTRASCYKSHLPLLPACMLAITIIAANTQLSKSLYSTVLRFRFHTHRPSISKPRERKEDERRGIIHMSFRFQATNYCLI
jgi:hypothetical protein